MIYRPESTIPDGTENNIHIHAIRLPYHHLFVSLPLFIILFVIEKERCSSEFLACRNKGVTCEHVKALCLFHIESAFF